MKGLIETLPPNIQAAIAELEESGLLGVEPQPDHDCKICLDMGYIKNNSNPGEPGFGKLFPCPNPNCKVGNERRREIYSRRYERVGLLAEYQGLTFKRFDGLPDDYSAGKLLARYAAGLFCERPKHAFSEADIYQAMGLEPPPDAGQNPKNSIVFCGEPGLGKTTMLACIVNDHIARDLPITVIRALDLIKSIQARYSQDELPGPESVVADFQTMPILAIDEMTIYNSERPDRLEKLEDIIRYRTGAGLPILVTTNHTQDEFVRAWGVRTADVLDAKAHWIEMSGLKLRQNRKTLTGI